jgi:catechol 2,3-dioxygenase-like lactoylglutathione lyase family enzyme
MAFGMPAITDFCFLVEDVERSVAFYREKLGFHLRTRAPGFADFKTKQVALALWEIDHIAATVGLSSKRSGPGVHKAVAAIELEKPEDVAALYEQLLNRGVSFISPPKDYPWRARCVYFTDPDEHLWEIYAWLDGARFGEVTE